MVKRAGGALLLSIKIDPRSGRALSIQLGSALRELILSGAVAPGERLPASRTLARELHLSRNTVIEAFDRLTAEGLIESRVGAGAFVSQALQALSSGPQAGPPPAGVGVRPAPAEPALSLATRAAMKRFDEPRQLPSRARAFTTALPAFEVFPMAQWARLSAKHWRNRARDDLMGYGEPFGHKALRQAIALHLRANRGIRCEAEQVFIFGGAQQAFSLIASTLLDPGDKVWFENPGAIGARNAFIAAGAELVPVPVDESGLDVAQGLRLAPRMRMAFVTPSHQQPLGAVMSLERRLALLDAAAAGGAWIVEDDYDGEFSFGGEPQPTLSSIDRRGLVIYVGTFSKSLFPSLRLGYVLAPPALVRTFELIATQWLHGVPTHGQSVLAEFIEEGHFSAHLRRMRRIYAERHQALCDAAQRRLRGALDIIPSQSGLHTAGWLRGRRTETAVANGAAERGVAVSPIGRYVIAPVEQRGLVLGFGGVTPEQIEAGVLVLEQVLMRR